MNKKALRIHYLEKRKEISLSEKLVLEDGLKKILFENFDFSNKITSCFLPIISKNEIDTFNIISGIKKKGGRIALTVWERETNVLNHRLFTDQTCIENNAIGIPEPQNGEFIPNELLDIVLVPLLVVDSCGNRVGYGKGVYDRFLANCSSRTIFIGLSLFEMIERIEDVDVYDIPLSYCITPTRCITFEK